MQPLQLRLFWTQMTLARKSSSPLLLQLLTPSTKELRIQIQIQVPSHGRKTPPPRRQQAHRFQLVLRSERPTCSSHWTPQDPIIGSFSGVRDTGGSPLQAAGVV